MKHQNKVILGGFMGNLVEGYDISLCYFMASELSSYLLGSPKKNATVLLTLTFIAYLAKPLGAFILGLLSDLYGRKNVLMGSVLIMGLATTLMGLIPNYSQIGFIAIACLLSLRILQSMALGSEFLNSASLLVESGDQHKRGFRGCWSSTGVKAGYLVACLIVEGMRYFMNAFPDSTALWRLPFLFAFLTTLVAFYVRSKMPESLAYVLYYAERKAPSTQDIYKQSLHYIKKRPFLFYFAFFSSFLSVTTGFFFYLYVPLHASQYTQHSAGFIMQANILSLCLVTVGIPLFGWLSDSQDRLKMLAMASLGLLLLAYPLMYAINYGNPLFYLSMQLLISLPCACYYSVATVLLTELFPLQIRCTTLSVVFSIAASLAAGLPPLLANYFAKTLQMPNLPCLIIITLACIVLMNIQFLVRYYRLGKNSYSTLSLQEETLIYGIQKASS